MPIGSKIDYFGLGIKGNIETRDYEISVVNGDDFDLKGWFVANGEGGTLRCLNRFVRGSTVSGSVGGSDDIPVIEHNHGASSDNDGEHGHGLRIADSGAIGSPVTVTGGVNCDFVGGFVGVGGIHNHGITVNNEGVSGAGLNVPGHVKAIPIMRIS